MRDVTKYNVFSHWLKPCKDIGRRPVLMWPLSLLLLAVVLVAAEQDERGGADAHLLAPRGLYLGTHALSVMYSLQWRHMSVMMSLITYCLFNRLFRQQIDGLMHKRHDWQLCLFCIKPSKSESNIKASHHWPFVRGIHQSLVDSPHKGPVMWKGFPCHDVIMSSTVCHVLVCVYCQSIQLIQGSFCVLPTQWETMLQCSIISHWLGVCTKWSLLIFCSILDVLHGFEEFWISL